MLTSGAPDVTFGPSSSIVLLDGPLGTELEARGVRTTLPLWSAHGLLQAPRLVRAIHREHARAGAHVLTACTFRTQPRVAGPRWRPLLRLAVRLAREAAEPGRLVAGSMAPLADCYRPDLSPPRAQARVEHGVIARALCASGVDLLLCETFPHVGEALVAAEQALETGVPVWISFTPGPDGSLLSPRAMADGARSAVSLGVAAVLVNCAPFERAHAWVSALADAVGDRVPVGCYANAGRADPEIGFVSSDRAGDVAAYAREAERWVRAGARIVGSCCGTRPAHVAALARRFAARATFSALPAAAAPSPSRSRCSEAAPP
ncbi:MAG: homocysteine S-methyltransferase family protein [Myxococcota bacterium]|nr:homocysteine S-methyltransferase family protein [Myxococcota bacterium]MDW8361956.1 homocysteine S-methyltransferase family protein [Myxococcales bacterium]